MTMTAAVVREFGKPLVIEEVPVPQPGPGQVLIEYEATGVCHTDLHAAKGDWPVRPNPPFIPGHEGVGYVAKLGAGVTRLKEGDRVGVPWLHTACGCCTPCRTGWETLCGSQQNTGYSVVDHCVRSHDYINVIVAGKQPQLQWLDMDAAVAHCGAGLGVWEWASNDEGDPDAVVASAGDVPTMEALAAVMIVREAFPLLRLRVVNVVDLMALQAPSQHPHGIPDVAFNRMFTTDKPVIFAYHGLSRAHSPTDLSMPQPCQLPRPWLPRGRHDHDALRHGRPQQACRFHLAKAVVERVPSLAATKEGFARFVESKLAEHAA